MLSLPLTARLFVGAVIGVGAALLFAFFPTYFTAKELELFFVLLLLSSITSVFKVNLPLARRSSTMSVSYAVDFASLLLLGPHETMIVAAVSRRSAPARSVTTTVCGSAKRAAPSTSVTWLRSSWSRMTLRSRSTTCRVRCARSEISISSLSR
jgi:hypothetical protein